MTTFEIRREPTEITRGGTCGTTPDLIRRHGYGPPEYYIDGNQVDEQTFQVRYAEALRSP